MPSSLKPFAGGKDPEGSDTFQTRLDVFADWKQEDIAEVLRTGTTPNHGRVGSSMADVVTNMAMLPQSDRDAIAIYIKSLPGRDTPQP